MSKFVYYTFFAFSPLPLIPPYKQSNAKDVIQQSSTIIIVFRKGISHSKFHENYRFISHSPLYAIVPRLPDKTNSSHKTSNQFHKKKRRNISNKRLSND